MNAVRGAAFWLTLLVCADSHGFIVSAARPRTLHAGIGHGISVSEGADAQRSRSTARLPPPAAHVLWQVRVRGGLSGNLLVDAKGRLFATGNGQVLQFSRDGQPEFDVRADFTSALASALGADGTRAVLTRGGRLLGFDARGELSFESELYVPSEAVGGHLVPSPAGGFLATLGTWAFHFGPRGERLARIHLPERVAHLVAAGPGFALVDERGDVHLWDGYARSALRARLGATVSACAMRSRALVLVLGERRVLELALDTGTTRTLFVEDAGLLPVLALPRGAPWLAFRRDGARIAFGTEGTPQVFPPPAFRAGHSEEFQLLAGEEGRSAWLAPRAPLVLGSEAQAREIAEVRCSEPLALASLGSERLAAACRAGEIWAIGP